MNSESVIYRKAVPADARNIADVHVASWKVAYRGLLTDAELDSLSIEKFRQNWEKRLSKDNEMTLVVEVDSLVVGFITVGPSRDDDCEASVVGEIFAIYLAPDNWRQGLGRELCRRGLDLLRLEGFSEAIVWVFERNRAARRFYEALGFQNDFHEKPYRDPKYDLKEVRYRITLCGALPNGRQQQMRSQS